MIESSKSWQECSYARNEGVASQIAAWTLKWEDRSSLISFNGNGDLHDGQTCLILPHGDSRMRNSREHGGMSERKDRLHAPNYDRSPLCVFMIEKAMRSLPPLFMLVSDLNSPRWDRNNGATTDQARSIRHSPWKLTRDGTSWQVYSRYLGG